MLLSFLCLNRDILLEIIKKRTDVRKSFVGKIQEVMNTDQENNFGGYSSKLSTHDETSTSHYIQSGRLDIAVQATYFINSTLLHPFHPKTMIQKTPPRRPHNFFKTIIYNFYYDQHSLQTLITLITYGNMSNVNFPSIKSHPKEYINCGID